MTEPNTYEVYVYSENGLNSEAPLTSIMVEADNANEAAEKVAEMSKRFVYVPVIRTIR